MLKFLEFVMMTEGVNPKLAAAQLSKMWRELDHIPEEEITARLNNTSKQVTLDSVVKLISEADPTPNKAYFSWLLTQFVNNNIRLPEDNQILHQDLTFYTEIKKNGVLKKSLPKLNLNFSEKQNPMDLTTLDKPTLQKIVDAVKELSDDDLLSKRKQTSIVKQEGANRLYKDKEWELIEVTDGKAACYYAKGTRWCTSEEGMANHYIKNGPLYIVFREGKPYAQIHFDSNQFMDPQDNAIRNISDELGEILLNSIPYLSKDDESLIYKHCSKRGSLYHKYYDILKEKFDNIISNSDLRPELSVYYDFDEDLYLTGYLRFEFPEKNLLVSVKNIEGNRNLLRDLRKNSGVNSSDSPRIEFDDGKMIVDFYLDNEAYGRDDEEIFKYYVKNLVDEYNDDDDYLKIKHNVYDTLVDYGVMERNINNEDHEKLSDENVDDNFKHFEFDLDEYNDRGSVNFESHMYPICTVKEAGLKLDNDEVLKGDFGPLEDLFESFIRNKSLNKYKRYRDQGWLPFPDIKKPRLPEDFVNTRLAPKVKVKLMTSRDGEKIRLKLTLRSNIHENNKKEITALIAKVHQLDEHFIEILHKVRGLFLSEIVSTVKQRL